MSTRSMGAAAGRGPDREYPTRRTVVAGAAALSVSVAAARTARALPAPSAAPALTDLERALLSRATFGWTAEDAQQLATLGHETWLRTQLVPSSIDDSALDARLAAYDWIPMTGPEMYDHPTLSPWEIAQEGRSVRLLRATYSKRQLLERIVEFWTDHFNIFGQTGDTDVLKQVDDREVVRRHALGSFRDLLHASAKSPAMLHYLDNDTNEVGAPQENYAREVMELHTLGVDGPYTESDVRELARCFTGWTYYPVWQLNVGGTFRFRADRHDDGAKTVLGISIPAGGGMSDAETVLDALASHPSTARFVSGKLARWLLGYDPPQAVLDHAERVWRGTGGQIAEVVRALLSPRVLKAANPWGEPKLKRPFHWVVSMYRVTGVDLDDPSATIWETWRLGQTPFQWAPPNGYPDVEGAWASNLLPRWSNAAGYAAGWSWSTDFEPDELRAMLAGAPKDQWARAIHAALGGGFSGTDLAVIQAHADGFSSESNQAVSECFELAFSSPSFLRY